MSEKGGKGIQVVLIGGSVRPGNFTMKALRLVADELSGMDGVAHTVFDPAELALAQPGLPATADGERLQAAVAAATGVVLATPEFHGSFSSVIKQVIENLGFPSKLAGKPVALLGVAAGAIGAIKATEQLHGICSHVGAVALPGTVSVALVQKAFDEHGQCLDPTVEKRVRGVSHSLVDYIRGSICPRLALEAMVREGNG